MLKDITLGQYFPGDTVAHRLDPRTKLILVLLYIVALFQASGWVGYALVLLATLVCMAVSHISPKNIFKGLKPMLFIIALTALLNIFYTTGTPIRPGWIVTWEGIERAVKMMLRITLLIAGTCSLLRRYQRYRGKPASVLSIEGLEIDLASHSVKANGKPVTLTDTEYAILEYLVKNRGKVVTAAELYEAVWEEKFLSGSGNTVMVHVLNVRRKIEENPSKPKILRTVWGRGYQID